MVDSVSNNNHHRVLPVNASPTAVSVQSQLAANTVPPIPPKPVDDTLPSEASATAVDVLNQIRNGTVPPVPPSALSEDDSVSESSRRSKGRGLRGLGNYI